MCFASRNTKIPMMKTSLTVTSSGNHSSGSAQTEQNMQQDRKVTMQHNETNTVSNNNKIQQESSFLTGWLRQLLGGFHYSSKDRRGEEGDANFDSNNTLARKERPTSQSYTRLEFLQARQRIHRVLCYRRIEQSRRLFLTKHHHHERRSAIANHVALSLLGFAAMVLTNPLFGGDLFSSSTGGSIRYSFGTSSVTIEVGSLITSAGLNLMKFRAF